MGAGVSSIARVLRIASRVICLIVIAWFVVFVVHQASSASTHQQNELNEGSVAAQTASNAAAAASVKHESAAHRTLNETADALTSPFAGAVSGSDSEWTIHIVKTLLALLVYGFGLAFLARFLRVRV
jgi:ABC-type transport system involved in cytochrome c biogenesis permease component